VHNDGSSRQFVFSNFYRRAIDETASTVKDGAAIERMKPIFNPAGRPLSVCFLWGHNARKINVNTFNLKAKVIPPAGHVNGVCRGNERFRGRTSMVDTGASKLAAFDHGNSLPGV
jgi:hypothetical protein